MNPKKIAYQVCLEKVLLKAPLIWMSKVKHGDYIRFKLVKN